MIPKIIHHIWPGSDPFRYGGWRETWLRHHPDWTLYFWRIDNLPFHHMLPPVTLLVKNERVPYVVKSDLLRLEMLRIFGGIYADTDMECLKPFDSLLELKGAGGMPLSSFCGMGGMHVCNALIASVPLGKLISEASQAAATNVLSKFEFSISCYRGVVDGAGSVGVRKYLEACDRVFPYTTFYSPKTGSDSYARHHWTNSRPDGWTKTLAVPRNAVENSMTGKSRIVPPGDIDRKLSDFKAAIAANAH